MNKKPADVEVEVEYEAAVERRSGKAFVTLTRIERKIPVTGRGKAWSKITSRRSVQVFPFAEAAQIMAALTDAAFAAGNPNIHPHDRDGIEMGDEPQWAQYQWNFQTADQALPALEREDDKVAYWSFDEAVEAWRAEGHPPYRMVGRVDVDPQRGLGLTEMNDEYR